MGLRSIICTTPAQSLLRINAHEYMLHSTDDISTFVCAPVVLRRVSTAIPAAITATERPCHAFRDVRTSVLQSFQTNEICGWFGTRI